MEQFRMGASEVFDDMPHWDRDADLQLGFDSHDLLHQLVHGVSHQMQHKHDGVVPDLPCVSDKVPGEVIWDREVAHELFDGMSSKDVSWDEEALHGLHLQDDLLQQVAVFDEYGSDEEMQSDIHLHDQGGNCFVGAERKLTDALGTNYLHIQVVLSEHVEFVDSKGAAHEMVNEISFEDVIWDEEVMPDQDTDSLLQLIVSDREHLDNEKAKSIIEFDDVGSIIWDEDMPHNLGMHLNLLEQFTDVAQGQGDSDFSTELGTLPLFLQHDVVIANGIFDVLAVQELNLGIENLVNCKKVKRASVCTFEKCGFDSLLGNLSLLGDFNQCSNVSRHMLEKMIAWRYGSFCPGQSELSVVDGEKLHDEIAFKANGNLHMKDRGAGFGVVLSLLLRQCRGCTTDLVAAQGFRVVRLMPNREVTPEDAAGCPEVFAEAERVRSAGESEESFMAFAWVFSGLLRAGQKVFVLSLLYDPVKGDAVQRHVQEVELQYLYGRLGQGLKPVVSVGAGNEHILFDLENTLGTWIWSEIDLSHDKDASFFFELEVDVVHELVTQSEKPTTSVPATNELHSKINSSVRMQWDPGISTATAWGQAVFRGGGNVMTHICQERPKITKAHLPKLQPKKPKPSAPIEGTTSTLGRHRRTERKKREEKGKQEGVFLLPLLQRSYPPLDPPAIAHAPGVHLAGEPRVITVLRKHDHAFASRPASRIADALFYGSSDIGLSPYGEHWRQLRRLVTTHLFTVKKVNSYRRARQDEVRLVMDKIREAAVTSKAVDISETMNTYANDIVCRAVSGKFFRGEGRNKLFRELIEMNSRLIDGFNLEEYFPGLANALSSLTRWFASNKAKEVHRRWDELLETIISDHERRGRQSSEHERVVDGVEQEESDFIDVLLSVQEEYGITRDHIKAILMDMFGAGTDTSSLVLELAMAELMRNPQLMTRLQAEVRDNTPEGQELVAQEDIARMTYLKAVVKETLRLHPPAPLLIPHLSMADCEVDGYTIPAGMRVIVNGWAIGRDPEVWEKADEFIPERFMDGGSATAVDFRGNDFQFVPFGAGRRICPGLNFGMATVEIMLANLVYCFDWELPAGMEKEDIDLTEVFGLTVHPKEKLILVPKTRGTVHSVQAE